MLEVVNKVISPVWKNLRGFQEDMTFSVRSQGSVGLSLEDEVGVGP